jgi:hypothetical protein
MEKKQAGKRNMGEGKAARLNGQTEKTEHGRRRAAATVRWFVGNREITEEEAKKLADSQA